MTFLKIKIDSTQENDFQKEYANGLSLQSLRMAYKNLPGFYTDYLTLTKSVTSFKLQELNINEAKKGRVLVSAETVLSTALILENAKAGKFQLYFKTQSHTIYNKLYRFVFIDNSITYISEPFFVYE